MYLYIPPRVVAFLCFLQVFFVTLGYLVTCSCVRAGGGLSTADALLFHVWAYAPWCLAVPLLWGLATIGCMHAAPRRVPVMKCMFAIGLLTTTVLFLGFATVLVDSLCVCVGCRIPGLS